MSAASWCISYHVGGEGCRGHDARRRGADPADAGSVRTALPMGHQEGGRKHEERPQVCRQAIGREEGRRVRPASISPIVLWAAAHTRARRRRPRDRPSILRTRSPTSSDSRRSPIRAARRTANSSSRATSSSGSVAPRSTRARTSGSAATTRSGRSCTAASATSIGSGSRAT